MERELLFRGLGAAERVVHQLAVECEKFAVNTLQRFDEMPLRRAGNGFPRPTLSTLARLREQKQCLVNCVECLERHDGAD